MSHDAGDQGREPLLLWQFLMLLLNDEANKFMLLLVD